MSQLKPYTLYESLKGKMVYITGGASGIGAALVRAFCAQSMQVVFSDIDERKGAALVRELTTRFGPSVRYEKVDVTNVSALQNSISGMITQYGKMDILVNNVGNDERHDPLSIDKDGWRNLMAVNLDAAFFASQEALKSMTQKNAGVIVNLGSINAILSPAGMPAYVAAKAGIDALSKALARQYGVQGIRVNTIAPGWVATQKQLNKWLTPDAEKEWQKLVSLQGRIMPDDVANLALFLASDDSAFITGQSIAVDAGRT